MSKFKVGDKVEVTFTGVIAGEAGLGGFNIDTPDEVVIATIWPNDFQESGTVRLVQEALPTGFGAVIRTEGLGLLRRAPDVGGVAWWLDEDGYSWNPEHIRERGGRVEVLFEGVTE